MSLQTELRAELSDHLEQVLDLGSSGKNEQGGKVVVTHHAISRLRDPMRVGVNLKHLSDHEARKLLTRAALQGEVVGKRPGGAVEMAWDDLHIIVGQDNGTRLVLTVTGNRAWRHWYRRTHLAVKRNAKVRACL